MSDIRLPKSAAEVKAEIDALPNALVAITSLKEWQEGFQRLQKEDPDRWARPDVRLARQAVKQYLQRLRQQQIETMDSLILPVVENDVDVDGRTFKKYDMEAFREAVFKVLEDPNRKRRCWHIKGRWKGMPNRSGVFKEVSEAFPDAIRRNDGAGTIADRTADIAIKEIIEESPKRIQRLRKKHKLSAPEAGRNEFTSWEKSFHS